MTIPINSNTEINPGINPEISTEINKSNITGWRRHMMPIGVGVVVAIILVTFVLLNTSKKPERVYTIGVLRYIPTLSGVEEGFYKGMEDLGYVEGKNVQYIITEYGNKPANMQGLAQELIDQNVDIIMAVTNVAATGAKKATAESQRTDIPIVFTHANSVVETGLVESFKSSGNNLTGVYVNFNELTEKKVDFLRRINPSIKRIGILDAVHTDPSVALVLTELKNVAPKFGIELVSYKVENNVGPELTAELTTIVNKIQPGEVDAFYHLPGQILNTPPNPTLIFDMTKRLKIPIACVLSTQVVQGCLLSYSQNLPAMGEQTSVFVDKIIKGQKPGDIPIEFGLKNSLALNLKTARDSGITFPDSMLSIAEVKVEE